MTDDKLNKHVLNRIVTDPSDPKGTRVVFGCIPSSLSAMAPPGSGSMVGTAVQGPVIDFSIPPIPLAGTGIKHDQDKADMSLLSNLALLKVAQVMTFGKKKYSAHNWRGGFIWSRPLAASLRHVFAYLGGEDKDPETGISHLAHAVCCLMFVLEFEDTHKELDDRFKGSAR